ncbi:hypothetical protein SUSAZ_02395 [Sulfolobus acidocaldarius SUSAZ]|nr:hypothetical protein SUSAZ_02395 [Sulfolobus acidocaldarius SUSAZ]
MGRGATKGGLGIRVTFTLMVPPLLHPYSL